MANTGTILQQAAQTTYQQSSPSCLTRANQKSLSLRDWKYWRIFWGKKAGERAISRKMKRTERPAGLGRRTREETGKGNQRLSWDSRQEDDIRHPQPPSGGYKVETWYKKIYVCHLLKPNWKPSSSHSISILTNISAQFLLQSVCVCVCVCVCVFPYNTLCKLFYEDCAPCVYRILYLC